MLLVYEPQRAVANKHAFTTLNSDSEWDVRAPPGSDRQATGDRLSCL